MIESCLSFDGSGLKSYSLSSIGACSRMRWTGTFNLTRSLVLESVVPLSCNAKLTEVNSPSITLYKEQIEKERNKQSWILYTLKRKKKRKEKEKQHYSKSKHFLCENHKVFVKIYSNADVLPELVKGQWDTIIWLGIYKCTKLNHFWILPNGVISVEKLRISQSWKSNVV